MLPRGVRSERLQLSFAGEKRKIAIPHQRPVTASHHGQHTWDSLKELSGRRHWNCSAFEASHAVDGNGTEHFPAKLVFSVIWKYPKSPQFRVRHGAVRLSLGQATCSKPSLCDARRRATSIWVQHKCEPHSSGAWWGPEALGVSTGQFWLRTTLRIHSFMNRFEHMRFHWNEELNYFSPKKIEEERNRLHFLCFILCIDSNVNIFPFNTPVCQTALRYIYWVRIKMPVLYFVLQTVVIVHGCREAN